MHPQKAGGANPIIGAYTLQRKNYTRYETT
jgi:hypothetical protein